MTILTLACGHHVNLDQVVLVTTVNGGRVLALHHASDIASVILIDDPADVAAVGKILRMEDTATRNDYSLDRERSPRR